jgi:CheY-specific phosphatase CheX
MPEAALQMEVGEALREAVTEVLEKMFFIRALEDPRAALELCRSLSAFHGEAEIATRVVFHGEPSGVLSLRTDYPVARAIAADFLAEEGPELSARQVEEVVAELANMICGAVLSRVESAAAFRLDPPAIVEPAAADIRLPETAVRVVPICRGALTVKVWMEARPCGLTEKSAS